MSELETSLSQMKDQLLRKAAEFENYKRRVENEYIERIKFANEDLLAELLPVVDDLERSLRMIKGRSSAGQDGLFSRGVELIYQKFMKILEAQGLKHYEVVGKPFDAYYHDALMQIPRDDVPPHTIIEEVEKGFMLHDKVLRHAKVIVAAREEDLDAGPAAGGKDDDADSDRQGDAASGGRQGT
jgi:molecular chaperone GrpE